MERSIYFSRECYKSLGEEGQDLTAVTEPPDDTIVNDANIDANRSISTLEMGKLNLLL